MNEVNTENAFYISPENPWLAPLAGWSDLPFRLICREEGARVACTEMVSAKGLVYGGKNTEELLATTEADYSFKNPHKNPLVVQIFGAEHEFMKRAVYLLQRRGFQYFDVNVGCSVAKVVKTGAGAAMLKDVDNLIKVAEHVIKQVHTPKIIENFLGNAEAEEVGNAPLVQGKIGFKLRLGYEMGKEVYLDVAHELERLGLDWMTLHPRYAKQSFSGVPKYEALAELKSSVKMPIIASGDLFTADDGVRVLQETGVDAVMYARGAMANPFIFEEHKKLWEYAQTHKGEEIQSYRELFPQDDTLLRQKLHALIERHYAYAKLHNPRKALLLMRTIVPRYIKHLENAKTLRLKLIACQSEEGLYSLLNDFFC